MGKITLDLIRKRAEHNEGLVSTLEEVTLHQQDIEVIELLGTVCPHLKILYLQSNLISKIQNLHKLKKLEYINLAVNNITKIQNLQRCESLAKLDLTMNFIPPAGLLSLHSLAGNVHLKDLFLMGNPCTDWPGYRQYTIATLTQLKKLDGQDIKHSERIAAQQVFEELHLKLREELRAEGIDPDTAGQVEDDSIRLDENGEVAETGYVNEKGELVRPWCPATRILDHREMEKANLEAEAKRKESQKDHLKVDKPQRLDKLPEMNDTERFFQRNDGKWEYSLEEDEDGSSIVLEVDLGKYLDTSLIQSDVQPKYIRLLIKGKLLQLLLPAEVKPDQSTAKRSTASGRLVITMPKEHPEDRTLDYHCVRPSSNGSVATTKTTASTATKITGSSATRGPQAADKSETMTSIYNIVRDPKREKELMIKEVHKATVVEAGADDDDFIPDL